MHLHLSKGTTLIELLIVLVIASILLVAGSHGLGQLQERQRTNQQINQINGAIQTARSLAVSHYQRVGICPVGTQSDCDTSWSAEELALFIDINRNSTLDGEDEILRYLPWNNQGATITWRNWLSKPAIVFQPDGSALSNGTLLITNRTDDQPLALILNKGGRLRIERRAPE